ALEEGLAALEECTQRLCTLLGSGVRDALAGATPYLALAAHVGMAWMWLRMASRADAGTGGGRGKGATARFYAAHLMPACPSLASQALAGAETLDATSLEELTSH
ncbi:MAG: acyl-CoA dehydrogenase C-terminal domain-containing protein, partial [Candidatus Tectimicrobiota bacterium]